MPRGNYGIFTEAPSQNNTGESHWLFPLGNLLNNESKSRRRPLGFEMKNNTRKKRTLCPFLNLNHCSSLPQDSRAGERAIFERTMPPWIRDYINRLSSITLFLYIYYVHTIYILHSLYIYIYIPFTFYIYMSFIIPFKNILFFIIICVNGNWMILILFSYIEIGLIVEFMKPVTHYRLYYFRIVSLAIVCFHDSH